MTTYTILLGLIIIVAVLLILIVMVQNPKGGGLSSTFGGGGQAIGGVQNTNNFLDRTTWTLAIAMFGLILLANFAIPRGGNADAPQLDKTLDGIEAAPVETETPAPAPATSEDSDQ